MTDSPSDKKSKLIIDEDWKSAVQREKEELEQKQAAAATGGSDDSNADDAQAPQGGGELPPPPSASLEMLVTMLASQAVMAMGQMPNPVTGEVQANIDYARHYIDTISMLEEKTKGNLSPDEMEMLSQTTHQLRMLFLSTSKK